MGGAAFAPVGDPRSGSPLDAAAWGGVPLRFHRSPPNGSLLPAGVIAPRGRGRGRAVVLLDPGAEERERPGGDQGRKQRHIAPSHARG
jgi:hypothetical protein